MGKIIIVAALDGTFQRKAFGRILELVPLAEYVVKLSAVCMMCSNDAASNLTADDSTPTPAKEAHQAIDDDIVHTSHSP